MLRSQGEMMKRIQRKIWDSPCFLEEFCSHITTPQYDVMGTITHFISALEHVLANIGNGVTDASIGQRAEPVVKAMLAALSTRIPFYRKLAAHVQWGSDYHFSRVVSEVSHIVETLMVGEFFFLPVKIPSGPVLVMLEALDERYIEVTIVNPSPFSQMHRKTTGSKSAVDDCVMNKDGEGAPLCEGNIKILQNVCLTLSKTRRGRLASEAFWMFVVGGFSTSDEHFYQNVLTWATERDFEGQVAEKMKQSVSVTPAKGKQGGLWKPLVHALRHILHRDAELQRNEVKHIRYFVRQYFFPIVEKELDNVSKITLTQKKLIEAAFGTLALSCARASVTFTHSLLESTFSSIERMKQLLKNLPVKGEDLDDEEQAVLDVSAGWDRAQQADIYPLFDMFRRTESVEGFVGVKEEQAKATPINFFRVRDHVDTIQDAIVGIADAIQLFVRVSAHAHSMAVKNAHFLVVAAISHFVIEVLPPPVGILTRKKSGKVSIWDTPILYAQQTHLLMKLEELAHFFHWAYKTADPHRDQDGVHMVVTGALAAIGDNVLRTPALDLPSVVTAHINGTHQDVLVDEAGAPPGFSISSGDFMRQTELISFTYPEALSTRASVLDYFDELMRHFPQQNVIFKFEEGNLAKEIALSKLIKQIATAESFTPHAHPGTLSYAVEECESHDCFLCRYYVEFKHWRNLIGTFKATMSANSGVSVSPNCLKDLMAAPCFNTRDASLMYGLGHDSTKAVRYASDSDPKGYIDVGKDTTITEDDLLHVQTLPTFGVLGQRDVELLLSYLTTPYLRIPLVLRFYATEDRVSALMDGALCEMLHGVLFEPGRFLPINYANECPAEVPSEQPQLIATPYGLLINELQQSPRGVIEPLLRLLHLVKEMDAGTVFNESVTKIVFVLVRAVSHVESYMHTVLYHQARQEVHREDRSFVVPPEEHAYLQKACVEVRQIIRGELLPMLDSWIDELDEAISKNQLSNLDPSTATSMLCGLYQHQILLIRNTLPENYDVDFASRLLSSFSFLTTRFVWGNHVHFNEHELYLVLEKHRRGITQWLYSRNPSEMSVVLNSVVRVATGAGKRVDMDAMNYSWGFVAGHECAGRFTRADGECLARKGAQEGKPELLKNIQKTMGDNACRSVCHSAPTICNGMQDVEISLHSGCLTFKATFLKAIPQDIAQDSDVRELFEQQLRKTRINPEAMQCAIVEEATNRIWIQLVGLEHDIQYWRTFDPRVPIPSDSMRFYPDDCEITEKWIAPAFELYRRAFFQRSFFQPPILILLPEEKLTDDANVAMLTAVCSATGEKLKEIYVFRDQDAVHIYDVVSHGRRFYRQLVFTSDQSTSLVELGDVGGAGDGSADKSVGRSTSAVILRRPTHPRNLSRSFETYIPARFLEGLIPSALITTHTFWQDEDDNIRGYPNDVKAPHLLWLHWKELRYAPLGAKSIGVQVFRFSIAAAAPRASEEAVLKSQRLQLRDEIEEGLFMTRTASTVVDSEHEGAELSAGMYRQSSVVHMSKPDSATIEDNNLLLLNLLFARTGTPLHSLAKVLTRVEPLSQILVWTSQTDYDTVLGGPATLDLIFLPRLKLSFRAKRSPCGTTYLVYSLDHAHLHISNLRPGQVLEMTRGIPHSLILADGNDALTILVPRFSVARYNAASPFSVEVIVQRFSQPDWYESYDTKYYLYPVHISQAFLFTPSFASAAYLLLLRYLHRNYAETFRLIASVGTDEEIQHDVRSVLDRIAGTQDAHPDAIACMARLSLYVNSPSITFPWRIGILAAHHVRLQSRTSVSCLMPPDEEMRLLEAACLSEDRVQVMIDTIRQNASLADPNGRRNFRAQQEIMRLAAIAMREKLGVRVSSTRLASVYTQSNDGPLDEYYKCLLFNRRAMLKAEHDALERQKQSLPIEAITLLLSVPTLPADPRLHLYRDYDPASITVDLEKKLFNDDGNTVQCSNNHDYYYCGSKEREGPCRCGYGCRATCGSTSRDGCPCESCERFNKQQGKDIRLLPTSLDYKNPGRPIPFMEISAVIRGIIGAAATRKEKYLKFPSRFHSEAVGLRHPLNGFFLLYEMVTGSRPCKIGKRNVGRDLAQLLMPMYTDGCDSASALSHLIQYIVRLDKERLAALPQFPKKGPQLHISEVHSAVIAVLAEDAARNLPYPLPPAVDSLPKYERVEDRLNNGIRSVRFVPRRTTRDASIALSDTRILPTPRDTECDRQTLTVPNTANLQTLGDEATILTVTAELLRELTGWPVESAIPEGFLKQCKRSELGYSPVPDTLPFDMSKHPDASMSVARDMLQRLKHEVEVFASRSNDAPIPKVHGLESSAVVREVIQSGGGQPQQAQGATILSIRKALSRLLDNLVSMRKKDVKFVAYANGTVLRTANFYSRQSRDGTLLLLRTTANREPDLKLDYLLSALCSTTCVEEWLQLNPFLTAEVGEAVKQLLMVSILRANRIGHINRLLEVIRELDSLLQRAENHGAHDSTCHVDALVASAAQKADTLASMLMVRKCYFSKTTEPTSTEGAAACPKTFSIDFDPRHMLFEFTWNLVMRTRQYELIGDMHDSILRGDSVVKQMIMGAGKTTVVSPLLGMMLANGRRLVVQVVPPALLDFTRAVMRTTFSSVLQKQIFTFLCDRTTPIDGDVMMKFDEAIRSRGIVVTTPSSVKSLFLKTVESCRRALIPTTAHEDRISTHKDAYDHLNVLSVWRDAILVMDEVDMLLHPLKSELNFPIGPKAELDFQPLRWKLPIHLLDIVYYYHTQRLSTYLKESPDTAPILARFFDVISKGLRDNALQEMPHLILLNPAFYESDMKPVLIEWLMVFIKAQHLSGLTDEETRTYLRHRPVKSTHPELVDRIEALDPFHKKVLNLSFEWISSYLPHILQKIDRVTFGIMTQAEFYQHQSSGEPRSRLLTAIPFVGKDMPSPSSEFAHPDIVIGLTILAYRYEGIRETDFHLIMQEIFAAVEREVGRFNQRRTTILYNKWVAASGGSLLSTYDYQSVRQKFNEDLEMGMQPSESLVYMRSDDGGDGIKHGMELQYMDRGDSMVLQPQQRMVLPLKLMKQANELEMKKLYKLFRRTPEVIHWYLTEQVFPEHMRHQETKLSASGQELGGDLLFRLRIGFSGTPSSLLPVELGRCGYEVGTDGQLIHTLTSPDIMSHTVVEPKWNVKSLLDFIATSQPPFHALIDTGALITGMSNLQVAQYLLKHGLSNMDGVVYLDEDDRKMILVRATGRSLLLSECGIQKMKRFAFYDQIHTTGMDIDHTPNAQAVQTIGKDMTFRDFSQGAYRMRGIGLGQTVHLLIIPEVYDLIQAVMFTVDGYDPTQRHPPAYQILQSVTAWLLLNSIRSEHTQHNQLRVQCCSNVWRKAAFRSVFDEIKKYKPSQVESADQQELVGVIRKALQVFDEPLDYRVVEHVPQPRYFSEMLVEHCSTHEGFVIGEGRRVINAIIDSARREDEMDTPVIDVEMVQEQEEEREREEQKEEEHEIEIEKYVDLDYNREHESSVPWRFNNLRSMSTAMHQFYALKDFHLFKRQPIKFPENILLTRNFYSTTWSGYRRIKNVVVTMEWTPDRSEIAERNTPTQDYGDLEPHQDAIDTLARTISILLQHQQSKLENDPAKFKDMIMSFLQTALQLTPSAATREWIDVLNSIKASPTDTKQLAHDIHRILSSNALRHEETGRYTVAVTLAEAETLRKILHFHRARRTQLIEGSNTEFGLRIVPSGNALLDESTSFVAPKEEYQRNKAFQCLRYFDGDLQYSDAEVGLLLRALHCNTQGARKLFFHQTISCRRRARQRWERAPISIVFLLHSALILLHQRIIGLCMCKDVSDEHGLTLADAFVAFNASGSGVLSAEEVWGGMKFCRLDLTAEDVLDFIDIADSQREGTVQYPDFLYMLSGTRDSVDDESDEQHAKNLPMIAPHGGVEITATRDARNKKMRAEEEIAARALADEERRVMEEIEMENIRMEMDILRAHPNPKLAQGTLYYDFASESQVPQLTSTVRGAVARRKGDPLSSNVDSCMLCANAAIRCSLRGLLKTLDDSELNQQLKALTRYTITTEFCIPKAARWGEKRRDVNALGVVELNIMEWQLPYHYYKRSSTRVTPIERSIAEYFKHKKRESEGVVTADSTVENENTEEGDDDEGEGQPMIFTGPVPTAQTFLDYLPLNASNPALLYVKMAACKRQTVMVNECSYEFGLLDDDRFPKGWICCRFGGEVYLHPLMARIQLLPDRLMLTALSGELPGPPYGRIQDSTVDPERIARWGQWFNYYEESDNESEEESNHEDEGEDDMPGGSKGDPRVHGDIEDLMLEIRRLRTLEKGDRVRRHPTNWQHGDEDGGDGTVGRVVAVNNEEAVVDVQWPNQNRTTCNWGKAGQFELMKVSKDQLSEVARKPENDDRHRELVQSEETKGAKSQRPQCEGCKNRFPIAELYACNECPKPVYLCHTCFLDGMHDAHEFTELRMLTKAFSKETKSDGSDEETSSSDDDASRVQALFDFGDDVPSREPVVAAEAKGAPHPLAKKEPEKPKDLNVLPPGGEISDHLPAWEVASGFEIGKWVRAAVRMPPSVQRGQIGFIVGHPSQAQVMVAFFSEILGDAKVHHKSVARGDLHPVKPFHDLTFGKSVIEAPTSLSTVLQSSFAPSLWQLVQAAKSKSTFFVGDCVAINDEESPVHCGTIAMVLNGKKYMVVSHTNPKRYILHESKLQRSFNKGTMVRFRRDVTYPHLGWPGCLPAPQRYTAEMRVTAFVQKNGLGAVSGESKYGRLDAQGIDLEESVEAKWVVYRPTAARWDTLPNSCRIIIDRSFSEGKRLVRFTFAQKLYRVDFPSNDLYLEEGGVSTLQGTLYRFPRLAWSRPKKLLSMDDGAWHLLSVTVNKNSVTAICDGEQVPLDIDGHFLSICSKQRRRTDLSLEKIQRGDQKKPKSSKPVKAKIAEEDDMDMGFDLFGDNDDAPAYSAPSTKSTKDSKKTEEEVVKLTDDNEDNEDDEEGATEAEVIDPPHEGPTIAELHPLYLAKPVAMFSVTDEISSGYKLLTFPQRFVTWVKLQWNDAEDIVEQHRTVLKQTMWTCTECRHSNPRHWLVCDECNVPRRVVSANRLLDRKPLERYRYVLMRSKEASHLRTKLGNKLRAMFQAQLDELQNPTAASDTTTRDISDAL